MTWLRMTVKQGLIAVLILAVIAIMLTRTAGDVIVNFLSFLFTVILGSASGVCFIIFAINYIEKNRYHYMNELSIAPHTVSPASHQAYNRFFDALFRTRWFSLVYRKIKTLQISLCRQILHSYVMKAQINNAAKVLSHPNSSVYDTIREFGVTPDEMLSSAYGPTAYADSTSAVCVSQSIDEIMHRVFEYTYRDYVETWYGKVSADRGNFHKILRADYWDVVKEFSQRLAKLDTVNLIMNRFVTCILHHMEELKRTAKSSSKDQKPSFSLHPCLRDDNTELAYLRYICDYILILTLPPESARISSLRYILREVLSGLAFFPMADTLCEPDYINQTILSYLQWRDTAQEEQTRAYAYAETYEDFIKIINECKNLSILRQIRYRIMTEIIHATTISSLKKKQTKAGKAKSMDKGELLMNRDLKRYINQCQVAKQQCDKKIRLLGGDGYGSNYFPADGKIASLESQLLSFNEIMQSTMARSYFLKYLRKIGKASLLKFWNETEILRTSSASGKQLAKIVSHLYQTHVINGSSDPLPFDIDENVIKGMRECVLGNRKPDDFFVVQNQVYNTMEKDHYPSFIVSDIYTYQLMPEIVDQNVTEKYQPDDVDLSKAAFGGDGVVDASLKRLKMIEEKLEYKAQALESLRPTAKVDPKVTEQLTQEIRLLQEAKWRQQLHMERSNAWWDHMGKWNAAIEKVHVLEEEGPVTPIYTIIVQCSGVPFYKASDDVSGWVVTRSLNDFHQLHLGLKDWSPRMKKLSLPKLPMFRLKGLSDKFLAESKDTLDDYLSNVLQDETLRCSQVVYSFLSPGPDVTDFSTREEERSNGGKFSSNFGGFFKRLPKDFLDRADQMTDDDTDELPEDDDESAFGKDSVAGPLYLLISEIFELHGLFRFLRRSLIIFVRVAFGRSINRQVRETSEWLVSEPMTRFYLQTFLDSMWPEGKLAKSATPRTDDEKLQTKLELQVKLLQNIPEALNGLVGQENAKRGVLKVFHALQDKRLNKHLFYTLLAESMEELFPEILRNDISDPEV